MGPQKMVHLLPEGSTKPEQTTRTLIELPAGELSLEQVSEIAKTIPAAHEIVTLLMLTKPGEIQQKIRELVEECNSGGQEDDFSALSRHGAKAHRRHLKPAARSERLARLARKEMRALFFPPKRVHVPKKKANKNQSVEDHLALKASANAEASIAAASGGGDSLGALQQSSKECTAREALTMRAWPDRLKTQGQLGRWRRAAVTNGWYKLPIAIAKKVKETPNWMRFSLNIPSQKGRTESWFLPIKVQIAYDELLNSRVNGCTTQKQVKEVLRTSHVLEGMKDIIKEYNQRTAKTNDKLDKLNIATYEEWEKGKITDDEA